MDEKPSRAFWIAGTTVLLVILGGSLLPFIIMTGGKSRITFLIASVLVLFESVPLISGTLAFAATIVLIVWLVNRRRGAP